MATKIYDLTQPIYNGMPVWPGHVRTVIWDHDTHEGTVKEPGGYSWASKGIMLCDHGPTHLDAVSHMDASPEAPTIDKVPLENCYTPGVCLDVSSADPDGYITVELLEKACKDAGVEVKAGDTVLLYTGHYERYADNYKDPNYLTRYAGLDKDATQWLVDKGIVNMGIDAPSTDNPQNKKFPSHLVCREHWLIHMENMANLGAVAGKRFQFIGLPLNILGAHGSPVRAIAVVEE